MRTTTVSRRVPDSYFDLVRKFPLRPIRSKDELERVIAVLLELSTANPEGKMDLGERDYLEALTLLVQRHEQARRDSALPKLTPADRIRFLMQERGMNVNALGRVIGSQAGASLILNGRRSPSKAQILKLARFFAVSSALFLE